MTVDIDDLNNVNLAKCNFENTKRALVRTPELVRAAQTLNSNLDDVRFWETVERALKAQLKVDERYLKAMTKASTAKHRKQGTTLAG